MKNTLRMAKAHSAEAAGQGAMGPDDWRAMKHPIDAHEESGCRNCPAHMGPENSDTSVQNLAIIPSQMATQARDGKLDVVLTAIGKGTFLIRRGNSQPANTCPLLSYEVRRIDPGRGPNPKPGESKPPVPSGNHKSRAACCELLLLVMMGQI